jgi:hypothetical protein
MKTRYLLLLISPVFFYQFSFSQKKQDTTSSNHISQNKIINPKDSLSSLKSMVPDTTPKKINGPRRAALRSAVLPGWGQATNKKYWKIPLVYGALGATAYAFNFNISQYKRVAYAYRVLTLSITTKDTSQFKTVDTDLRPFIRAGAVNDLRNYRNTFRKDIDYSVLIFLFFWGLNVVDATVDAHLKGFNVSDDLSMKIKPGFNPGTRNMGLSLVLDIHKAKPKLLSSTL